MPSSNSTDYTADAVIPLGAIAPGRLSTHVVEVEATPGAEFALAPRGRVVGNPRPLTLASNRLYTENRSTGQVVAGDITEPGIYAIVGDSCEAALILDHTSGVVTVTPAGAIG